MHVGIKKLAEDVSDFLDLPEDAVLGSARVEITAGKRLLIDNHHGVLSYSEETVTVLLPDGKLAVYGDRLRMKAMTERQLLIGGRIDSVEWIR